MHNEDNAKHGGQAKKTEKVFSWCGQQRKFHKSPHFEFSEDVKSV